MIVETTPASAAPARKRAGRRKRSDLNMSRPSLGADRVLRGVLGRRGLVTDTPHRDDRRSVAELPTKLADMDVDGPRISRERIAPDPLEQLVAGKDESVVVEQLPEQVEFLRCELNVVAVHLHLAAAGVDEQVAVADLRRLHLAALGRGAAEDRLHASDQLPWIERLRQVVVRADLEPDDLVDILVTSGQHQDGDVGVLSDPTADLNP